MHFGWYHTVFNSLGLFAFSYLLLWQKPLTYWALAFLCSPVIISLLMLNFNDVEIYRGYSGAFYSLLLIGLLATLKQNWRLSLALLALVAGKIFMEQRPNYDVNYLVDKIGVGVMVDAHFYGAIVGLLLFTLHVDICKCYRSIRTR